MNDVPVAPKRGRAHKAVNGQTGLRPTKADRRLQQKAQPQTISLSMDRLANQVHREDAAAVPLSIPEATATENDLSAVKDYLVAGQIGPASQMVMEYLSTRIARGDLGLAPILLLVQHCHLVIAAMPPLSHVNGSPLWPDQQLYACFDQFLSLLRQQEAQMQELQMMINELI